jgi:transcription elongation factor GreA
MGYPMTPRGNALLRAELKRLKALRPELAHAIEVARGHGDLSENADYDAAKERSGMTEAKIRDLEARITAAEIIDPSKLSEPQRVVFGTTVRIQDMDSSEERLYSIYGSEESDVSRGWISFDSPIARGLMGKETGDVTRISMPGGSREFEILEIFVEYTAPQEVEQEGN